MESRWQGENNRHRQSEPKGGMYNGFLFAKVRKYMMPVYKELRIDYCNFTCGKTKPEICNTTVLKNFGLYSECNLFRPWTEVLFLFDLNSNF